VAALGVGLLISTVAETQQQAMFVTFFVLIIYLFLSGLFTPVQSMPGWVQVIAELNPIRHFIVVVRGALMKGATLRELAPSLGALAAFAAVAMGVALLRYRKTTA
ncbi:MAG TPA: ABC transporter permease, partial [Rhodothermales bacterium]|nr:ABC transporter permease [Rhodothermales bacterium]